MKQNKKCWLGYLALFLLVFILFLPFKEGLEDGHGWLNFSSWFTTSETPTNRVTVSRSHYNTTDETHNEGTGNSGRRYIKTDDENDELTSNEKSYARSALNKISAMHDNNDVLKSCINKVKVYL